MSEVEPVVAVVGGTGALGLGLARRWAKAGLDVRIGSRTADRAREAAEALGAQLGLAIGFGANAEVAAAADIIAVTVPFAAQADTLAGIRDAAQGKIVLDTTVPLVPPRVARVQLPPEGSAAMRAQALLGDGVTVVSGFHNVAADKLDSDEDVDCDVLVFADDKAVRTKMVDLVSRTGLRGIHGGALANSAAAEAMTSVLIFINRHYSAGHAGVRITAIEDPGVG